jgi:LacI family transcriptional regulator
MPKTIRPESRVKREVLLLLGVYLPAHHEGVARYAREAGWSLNNFYAEGGLLPWWWKGDGMITLITHPKDYEKWRQLPKRPMVDLSKGWISNVMPPHMRRAGRGVPRVLENNPAIARLAAHHFLERGFRDVAFLNIGNFWMETERIPTFRRTLEEAGARYFEISYHRHFSLLLPGSEAEHQRALAWLVDQIRSLPKPVGIFAAADNIAAMLLRACDAAGVSVPEEVAVLGCDNQPRICDYATVPLSSVDQDLEQQGYLAAQLLDRLMDGGPPPDEPILVPPKGVVTRQSTNILAVPHVPVARAVRFIWENYQKPIQISDIVAAAGISRRGIEHAFRQHLKRSILSELTRCRIDHAKELLLQTDLRISQIATQCGFGSLMYFSKIFKQSAGTGPREFRNQHRAGA